MQSESQTTTIASSQAVRDLIGRKELSELMRRKDGPGLRYAAFHFGCIFITGYLVYLSLNTPWIFLTMFLHGLLIVHLFSPYHEASHSTPFASAWLNQTLAWVTGLILMLPPLAFKYEHADHHTYTGDPERDAQYIKANTIWEYLWYGSAIPYFINIFRNLFLQPFGWMSTITSRAVPDAERKKVIIEAWIFWLVYGCLAAVSIWYETWWLVIYWLVPRMALEPIERIIRMTEHVGCIDCPDMLQNSRTVLDSRLWGILSWNMPYHVAHHAAPLVPFFSLKELDDHLQEHSANVTNGYPSTIYRQIRILLQNKVDTVNL